MRTFLQDLQYGLRTLARSPRFTAMAIATLALGIGATTAMFSVVDGVLLKPLRYRDADRIVALSTVFTDRNRAIPRLTGGDYVDLRADRGAFELVASYYGYGEMGVQVANRAEFVGAVIADVELFDVFGVAPLHGRLFNADDAQQSAIVGLGFAERHFGSGGQAVGRALRLEDRTYAIVGVVPATFQFPGRTDLWLAAPRDPENLRRTAYNYRAVAKLRAGVSTDAANARLGALGARLATAYPDSNGNKSFAATPLRDHIVGPVHTTLVVLMGAVGLVLLTACANVANLLLARAAARSREVAVRASLGASRWRIVRQLLAESLVFALAAGALGIVMASVGTELLVRGGDDVPIPRLDDVSVDWRVLFLAIGVCGASAVVFGLVPAFQASRINLSESLKQSGARGVSGGALGSLRAMLVVAQIALSFVLVIGAGLLFRSFLSLMTVPLGFRTDALLVIYANAPARSLEDALRVVQFENELLERIRQLPGVASAAGAMGLPAGQYGSNGGYILEGEGTMQQAPRDLPQADFTLSTPAYFSTLGIPLVRGRDFTEADRFGAEPVAIVSEALVRRSFPNVDPIGRRLQCGLDNESMQWMTIVGVVSDVRQDSPASNPSATLYMPLAQHPSRVTDVQFAVRTHVDPSSLIVPVKEIVGRMNPEVALKFTTMDAMVRESAAAPRFRTALATSFAALALALALIGVYAVMSYVTVQRTAEFALRSALGAPAGAIVRLVLSEAARLAVIGVVGGVALAALASRAIATMLFGLERTDGLTYAIVIAGTLVAVLFAAGLPALRASRVDPLTALRND